MGFDKPCTLCPSQREGEEALLHYSSHRHHHTKVRVLVFKSSCIFPHERRPKLVVEGFFMSVPTLKLRARAHVYTTRSFYFALLSPPNCQCKEDAIANMCITLYRISLDIRSKPPIFESVWVYLFKRLENVGAKRGLGCVTVCPIKNILSRLRVPYASSSLALRYLVVCLEKKWCVPVCFFDECIGRNNLETST